MQVISILQLIWTSTYLYELVLWTASGTIAAKYTVILIVVHIWYVMDDVTLFDRCSLN